MTTTATDQAALTEQQTAMLDFEHGWWKYAGAKEQAIRERFDCSSGAYYQQLNAVIDLPAALAYDPLGVRRLRRLREQRQQQRASRRLGFEVDE